MFWSLNCIFSTFCAISDQCLRVPLHNKCQAEVQEETGGWKKMFCRMEQIYSV